MREILIFCSDPSGLYHNPIKEFKWTTTNYKKDDVVVYTDKMIMRKDKIGKIKIAWIFEPPEINPQVYDYIKKNYIEFDYIFTWVKELLSIDDRFKFTTYGTSWIPEKDYAIYEKSKLVSIVSSGKNQLPGHILRHQAIKSFNNMDVFGRGYNPIQSLLVAYKDHMFTVVIENVKTDCNMSEKLITPLLCGTIPIYYGCPSVGDYFDMNGILTFDTLDDLKIILNSLTEQKYHDMIDSVKINFERAKSHQLADDMFFHNLKKLGIL